MKGWLERLARRLETAWDFLTWMGRRRPWLLPLLVCLLLLTGLVSLAQATHVAPFIYTLF